MSKLAGLLFPGFFLLATTGCVTDGIPLIGLPSAPPPPKESFVLGADGGVLDKPVDPASPEGKLAGAKELFRNKEYSKAEKIFHRLADDKKIRLLLKKVLTTKRNVCDFRAIILKLRTLMLNC